MPQKHAHGKSSSSMGTDYVDAGDITTEKFKGGSAQERYYEFALAKSKAELASNKELSYLAVQSPVEVIAQAIARKLQTVLPGSAEWSMLCDIAGSDDRLAIARYLAKLQYKQISAAQVLSKFGADAEGLGKVFEGAWGSGDAIRKGDKAKITEAVKSAWGLDV